MICQDNGLDWVFVVDSASDVSADFYSGAKNFLTDVVDNNVGEPNKGAHLATVKFGGDTDVEFGLKEYRAKDA